MTKCTFIKVLQHVTSDVIQNDATSVNNKFS